MRNETGALAHTTPMRAAVLDAAQLLFTAQGYEIVEFHGRHLSKHYQDRHGGISPPAWRSMLSMLISYHLTRLLMEETQQLSADVFNDYFLRTGVSL